MNGNVFHDWRKAKVFPKLKSLNNKAVLVLDHATYHTMLTPETRPMKKSYSKDILIHAFKHLCGPPHDWPILWAAMETKQILFQQCLDMAPTPKYLVQELADTFTGGDFHIKIIFLPIAHPELKSIEHVWGIVKRNVASSNFSFRLTEGKDLTLKEINSFTGAAVFGEYRKSSKFYRRSIKEEDKYREAQKAVDEAEDQNAGDEGSSSESADESEAGAE